MGYIFRREETATHHAFTAVIYALLLGLAFLLIMVILSSQRARADEYTVVSKLPTYTVVSKLPPPKPVAAGYHQERDLDGSLKWVQDGWTFQHNVAPAVAPSRPFGSTGITIPGTLAPSVVGVSSSSRAGTATVRTTTPVRSTGQLGNTDSPG